MAEWLAGIVSNTLPSTTLKLFSAHIQQQQQPHNVAAAMQMQHMVDTFHSGGALLALVRLLSSPGRAVQNASAHLVDTLLVATNNITQLLPGGLGLFHAARAALIDAGVIQKLLRLLVVIMNDLEDAGDSGSGADGLGDVTVEDADAYVGSDAKDKRVLEALSREDLVRVEEHLTSVLQPLERLSRTGGEIRAQIASLQGFQAITRLIVFSFGGSSPATPTTAAASGHPRSRRGTAWWREIGTRLITLAISLVSDATPKGDGVTVNQNWSAFVGSGGAILLLTLALVPLKLTTTTTPSSSSSAPAVLLAQNLALKELVALSHPNAPSIQRDALFQKQAFTNLVHLLTVASSSLLASDTAKDDESECDVLETCLEIISNMCGDMRVVDLLMRSDAAALRAILAYLDQQVSLVTSSSTSTNTHHHHHNRHTTFSSVRFRFLAMIISQLVGLSANPPPPPPLPSSSSTAANVDVDGQPQQLQRPQRQQRRWVKLGSLLRDSLRPLLAAVRAISESSRVALIQEQQQLLLPQPHPPLTSSLIDSAPAPSTQSSSSVLLDDDGGDAEAKRINANDVVALSLFVGATMQVLQSGTEGAREVVTVQGRSAAGALLAAMLFANAKQSKARTLVALEEEDEHRMHQMRTATQEVASLTLDALHALVNAERSLLMAAAASVVVDDSGTSGVSDLSSSQQRAMAPLLQEGGICDAIQPVHISVLIQQLHNPVVLYILEHVATFSPTLQQDQQPPPLCAMITPAQLSSLLSHLVDQLDQSRHPPHQQALALRLLASLSSTAPWAPASSLPCLLNPELTETHTMSLVLRAVSMYSLSQVSSLGDGDGSSAADDDDGLRGDVVHAHMLLSQLCKHPMVNHAEPTPLASLRPLSPSSYSSSPEASTTVVFPDVLHITMALLHTCFGVGVEAQQGQKELVRAAEDEVLVQQHQLVKSSAVLLPDNFDALVKSVQKTYMPFLTRTLKGHPEDAGILRESVLMALAYLSLHEPARVRMLECGVVPMLLDILWQTYHPPADSSLAATYTAIQALHCIRTIENLLYHRTFKSSYHLHVHICVCVD
jgi:hypothetical protein